MPGPPPDSSIGVAHSANSRDRLGDTRGGLSVFLALYRTVFLLALGRSGLPPIFLFRARLFSLLEDKTYLGFRRRRRQAILAQGSLWGGGSVLPLFRHGSDACASLVGRSSRVQVQGRDAAHARARPADRREGAVELTGPVKWDIYCNWKNSSDNFVGDMYHAPISHRSAALARSAVTGNPAPASGYGAPGNQVRPGNGHGLHAHVHESIEEMFSPDRTTSQRTELNEYEVGIRPEIEERLGRVRSLIRNGHYTVFPNMSWLQGGTVRMWHPRGPAKIEVWAFVYVDSAASEQIKHLRRISSMGSFGPSGSFEQDDSDNWSQSTLAGKSAIARKYRQVVSMGIGHETTHPDLPGLMIPKTHGEINQRGMYLRWQEFMNAESWADMSIDPITADFNEK